MRKLSTLLAAGLLTVSFGVAANAQAGRAHAHHVHRVLRHHADAYAQAPAVHTQASDMQARQDCYAYAKQQVPSGSQDKQRDREMQYSSCAFDHGILP